MSKRVTIPMLVLLLLLDVGTLLLEAQGLTRLSEMSTFYNVQRLRMTDGFLFAIDYNKVYSIDIHNPAAPTVVDSFTNPVYGYMLGLEVQGSRLFATYNDNHLLAFEVTGDGHLTFRGQVATDGQPNDVAVNGNWAYVACQEPATGVAVVDITNLAAMTVVGYYPGMGGIHAQSVALRDTLLAIGFYQGDVRIANVANPRSVTYLSQVATPGFTMNLQFTDRYLLVSDGAQEPPATSTYLEHLIDFTNPATAYIAGTYTSHHVTSGGCNETDISGDYLYLADLTGGVKIIDISDLRSLRVVDSIMLTEMRSRGVTDVKVRDTLMAICFGSKIQIYSTPYTGGSAVPGPVVAGSSPARNDTTCCVERIDIQFTSSANLDLSSVDMSIDGVRYTGSTPGVTVEGTEWLHIVPTTALAHGMHTVTLLSIADTEGNPLRGSYTFSFLVDRHPPTMSSFWPTPGSLVSSTQPSFSWQMRDDLARTLRPQGMIFSLDDMDFHFDTTAAGWFWDGLTAQFVTAMAGVTLTPGEHQICLSGLYDWPDCSCGGNELDTCITLTVASTGPVVSSLGARHGQWTGCEFAPVELLLRDPDGINPMSIVLQVQGTEYHVGSGGLTWTAPETLRYTPSAPWTDGQVVRFTIQAVTDAFGNGLASPVTDSFRVDLTAPQVLSINPTPGSVYEGNRPYISLTLDDLPSGLSEDNYTVTINSVAFGPGDTALIYDADMGTLAWSSWRAGMAFDNGTTVRFCLTMHDLTVTCANVLDTCFSFTVHNTAVEEWGAGASATLGQPYPNPSRDGFRVSVALASGDRLDLWDLLGTPLADLSSQSTGNGVVQFRDDRLAPGIYWIVLQREGTREVRRWIRQ